MNSSPKRTRRLILAICILISAASAGYVIFLYTAALNADRQFDERTRAFIANELSYARRSYVARFEPVAVNDALYDALANDAKGRLTLDCSDSQLVDGFPTIAQSSIDGAEGRLCEYGRLKSNGVWSLFNKSFGGDSMAWASDVIQERRSGRRVFNEYVYNDDFVVRDGNLYFRIRAVLSPETNRVQTSAIPYMLTAVVNFSRNELKEIASKAHVDFIGSTNDRSLSNRKNVYLSLSEGDGVVVFWPASRIFVNQLAAFFPLIAFLILLVVTTIFVALREMDRSHRLLSEQEMAARYAANHDAMTGLSNRAKFFSVLKSDIAGHRAGVSNWVGLLDIDHFKSVNDQYGHAVGDELIIATAKRLSLSLGTGGLVARLGGDEFAMIFYGDRLSGSLETLLNSTMSELKKPLSGKGWVVNPTVSIGVAEITGPELTPAELLKSADIALYEAKREGRDRFCISH